MISFKWPELLWLMLALPVLVALYVTLLRRRRAAASPWAGLAAMRTAPIGGARRHLPPLLMLLALAAMLLAVARPVALVTLPSQQQSILLAMDVSGSMRAKDVKPSRLAAAQASAKAFVEDLPRDVRVGVVSFAATASLVQAPTHNREDVMAAIDRFQLQRGTAIGSGIVVSLAAIFPDEGIEVMDLTELRDKVLDPHASVPAKPEFKPVPPGSYDGAAIIVLTDGQRTTGPDPLEAARLAADHGVRVFTVGVGTPEGETLGSEGWSMRVRLDEETLKAIAQATHGEYFYAGNAGELKKVYKTLNSRLALKKKETEVSALFSAVGALLALVSAALSLLWFNRVL